MGTAVPWPGGSYPIDPVPIASGNVIIHPAK